MALLSVPQYWSLADFVARYLPSTTRIVPSHCPLLPLWTSSQVKVTWPLSNVSVRVCSLPTAMVGSRPAAIRSSALISLRNVPFGGMVAEYPVLSTASAGTTVGVGEAEQGWA